MQTIRIIRKSNYGTESLYISEGAAKVLRDGVLRLVHKKTVNDDDLEALQLLGFEIVFE